jgi:hypothetical protein
MEAVKEDMGVVDEEKELPEEIELTQLNNLENNMIKISQEFNDAMMTDASTR